VAKKPQDSRRQVVDAALDLAAERGWNRIALSDIAGRAGVPLGELYRQYPSKAAILDAYVDDLDRRMVEAEVDIEVSTRDRLFEIVMRRFEAMTPHKEAIRVILRDAGGDPLTALCGARRFMRTVALMLEAAGISSSGLGGIARSEGMAAIYAYALRAWLADDTPDMSHTMAALDKALRRGESLAGMIWRGRGTQAGPTEQPSA